MFAPFAFKDNIMEQKFVHSFVGTSIDRIRPVVRFLIPVLLPLRIFPLIIWIFSEDADDAQHHSAFFCTFQAAANILTFLVISKEWTCATKQCFGLLFLWLTRLGFLSTIYQMREKRDIQVFATLVSMICAGGLMIPSYAEYLVLAFLVSYLWPLQKFFTTQQASSSDLVQEIIYQHTLVLALGISIHWAVHSDLRRTWLRSASANLELTTVVKPNRRVFKDSNEDEATSRSDWDQLRDGYFSNADRLATRVQALQVCWPTAKDLPYQSNTFTPLNFTVTVPILQECAAMEERLVGLPDSVPLWHRATSIVGAGPTGCVYQVLLLLQSACLNALG